MRIAACLIVKNESWDVAEWIAFHAAAGMDSFLVYENGSSDGTGSTLRAAAAVLDVRVVDWPDRSGGAQKKAYEHAMRTFGREFDWIAVIDSDEFLVAQGAHSVRSVCAAAPDEAGAIAINWAMFGSSGHVTMPRCTVIEAFTRRSETGFHANRHVKSIVRPHAVRTCLNPHAFDVEGPTVGPGGMPVAWLPDADGRPHPGLTATVADHSVVQVNHYFTRSHEHWARKTLRSYPNPASREKLAQFGLYDRNEVEDRSAQRHLAAMLEVRSRIFAASLCPAPAPSIPVAPPRPLDLLRNHGWQTLQPRPHAPVPVSVLEKHP